MGQSEKGPQSGTGLRSEAGPQDDFSGELRAHARARGGGGRGGHRVDPAEGFRLLRTGELLDAPLRPEALHGPACRHRAGMWRLLLWRLQGASTTSPTLRWLLETAGNRQLPTGLHSTGESSPARELPAAAVTLLPVSCRRSWRRCELSFGAA